MQGSVDLNRDPAIQSYVLFVDGILLVGNPDKDDSGKMAERCSCPVNAELCP